MRKRKVNKYQLGQIVKLAALFGGKQSFYDWKSTDAIFRTYGGETGLSPDRLFIDIAKYRWHRKFLIRMDWTLLESSVDFCGNIWHKLDRIQGSATFKRQISSDTQWDSNPPLHCKNPCMVQNLVHYTKLPATYNWG